MVRRLISRLFVLAAIVVPAGIMMGQEPPSAPAPQAVPAQQQPSTSTQAPLTLTLQDALARARKYSVEFNAALTDQGVAHQDKVQARAGLLPGVTYNNQALYTQGNGSHTNTAIFVANNAVHEYISQGNVHESVGFSDLAAYRRSRALEAVARARAEIAARGLVVTVVQSYYGLIAAQRKYANTQQAVAEAQRFLDVSQKLENGGEVAHADVIKAQIQSQDRRRDLREAQLGMDKSRLDLAVLLFPDFNENFNLVDDLDLAPPLQTFDDFERAAQIKNPELRASVASLQAAQSELTGARAGYLPSLGLDYWYGIDSTHFATHTTVPNPLPPPDLLRLNALGSSASATLNIPVWNWGITHSKVVQADLKRKQAQRELSFAQRKLLAEIRTSYDEAQAAVSELDLLKSSAELAAESLRLTTLRYQAGESTVLEVVDAQNTLTQARNAYSDGVVRYRTALAGLQVLTGNM
ncbi:MAG TPA: TolC family protein [Candidatus Angelobacter sp.]|nr:TolC family protein [Candidatus Angelobacter sp.]